MSFLPLQLPPEPAFSCRRMKHAIFPVLMSTLAFRALTIWIFIQQFLASITHETRTATGQLILWVLGYLV